jgi:hypothetical protein
MGNLRDWAKKVSPFIAVTTEEPFVGKFMGYKMVPNRFDTEKETVRYLFELPDGTQKPWENGQAAVASTFDGIEKETWVKITRLGEGNKTKYEIVKVADKSGEVTIQEAKQMNEEMIG